MKIKILAVGAIAALLALAGCGGATPEGDNDPAPVETTAAAPAEETTDAAAPVETTEQAPAEEEQPAEEAPAADSEYAVTIDGSHVTTDYEGNPALVVDFTFTNNSAETTSFMLATYSQAFQDGVQLETAIIMGDAEYEAENEMKDLRPGASLPVQQAFVLTSESEVEIEVTEFMSMDDVMLATAVLPVA